MFSVSSRPPYGIAARRLRNGVSRSVPRKPTRNRPATAAPGERYVGLVLLFSTHSGEPLLICPDGVMQRMRVGGTNGVATKYLARGDAESVGLIGSGWQAGTQVMAVCVARRIKKIKVYSPTRANRESFAREMSGVVGVEMTPVDSQKEAVRGVDIIITSTNSRKPFLGPEALSEGVHLSCMQRDEANDEALRRCSPLLVHTNLTENNSTSSHWNEMAAPGLKFRDHPRPRGIDWKILPTLADLVAGRTKGRERAEQISGFVNNIGLGAQFAVVGAKVYDGARAKGLGRELPLEWFTQDVHP